MTPRKLQSALRARALEYPDTEEAFPWGERVIKVKKKVFVFLGDVTRPEELRFTVKLPMSGKAALKLPWAKPTGYGLGKSGWVSFAPGTERVELEQIFAWLDESFRAVAPKTVVAKLGESASPRAKRTR